LCISWINIGLKTTNMLKCLTREIWTITLIWFLKCCFLLNSTYATAQILCPLNISFTKSFRTHYGPGVDSAHNRNEHHDRFLGVKAAGALGSQFYHFNGPIVLKFGTLNTSAWSDGHCPHAARSHSFVYISTS